MSRAPEYLAYAESFNRKIKALVLDIMKRCPSDPVIARIHKRVGAAVSIDPLSVIKLAGPHLYKYQKKIYDRDESFFLENDYDTELKAAKNPERIDAAQYLIPRIKECARTLSPAEKEMYKDTVVELLDDYVEFAAGLAEAQR